MNPSNSSSYSLEITINSAEALTIRNHKRISKNVFVTVSTENQGYSTQMQTRPCDQDNKARPTWNEKFLMAVPMNAKYLHLEVSYKKKSRNKLIGTAKVQTSDFFGNTMPVNYQHCLCYRLRDSDGEPNGIISFSVKVTGLKGIPLDSRYDRNQNYKREAIEIQGFSYRENHYGQKPWIGTSLLSGGSRNSTAAAVAVAVGIPTAWYNSCHASLL